MPRAGGRAVESRVVRPAAPRHPVRRDLHRLPDRVHAGLDRRDRRLRRARPARAAPDDAAGLLGHARSDARVGAVLPVHGVPARAVGADGATFPRRAARARPGARLALPRRAADGDDLCGGHRHRRLVGDAARRDGRAGDDEIRVRHTDGRRDDHRGRHARHPDSAVGDADRHGSGRGRPRDGPVRGGGDPGPDAVSALHRLHAGAELPEPEARPRGPARRARRVRRRDRPRARVRHGADRRRDLRDARRDSRGDRDADRRGRRRLVRRAADDAGLPAG